MYLDKSGLMALWDKIKTMFAPKSHTHDISTLNGTVKSAAKLSTARTIALSGAVSGSAKFDGSGDVNISTTANNSDSVSLQRQIVPSASVESSTTASQAYSAGQYVVVNGVLRKVKSAIAKGNAISDSNSTATTVGGELATIGDSASRSVQFVKIPERAVETSSSQAVTMAVSWPVDVSRIVAVIPTYTCSNYSDRVVLSDWDESGVTLRTSADQFISISLFVLYV